MFNTVVTYLESLGAGEAAEFATDDKNLAIAALFYHMIAVDGVVRPAEKTRFNQILETRFGLTTEKLTAFSIRAKNADIDSSSLFPFTSIINHECDGVEKSEIVEQLKLLARSDGVCHPLEAGLVMNIAELLRVPFDRQFAAGE